tara:strand:+ start:8393 stop:9055 length:663 start_codon:yes stop_codon:yes gene_type:complete
MKVINLLCRGRSLSNFGELLDPQLIVLANDFDRELLKFPSLYEYVFKHKLHLVMNMVIGATSGYHEMNFFQKFNVVKLIRPYTHGIRIPGSSNQNIPLDENFLDDHHKEFMYTGRKYAYDYAGTGIAAFAYTILDLSADVINIVGMDFYDNLNYGISNYLTPCREGGDYKKDPWTQKEMQENFCKLVKSKPNTQVNITTYCKTFIDEMNEIENLNIKIIK